MLKKIVLSISCFVFSAFVCGAAEAVTCQSGYVAYNNACYQKLTCKNGGTQQGDKCVCAAGWKGKTCAMKNICAYTTTKCVTGYVATGNTCQSGSTKYVECKAKECKGYDYTTCPKGYKESSKCTSGTVRKVQCKSCADGYVKYDGKCYKKLSCKNGGTQEGEKCKCKTGWKGDLCQTAKTCSYTTKECGTGYTATGKTCQSGNNKYVECKANECAGYDYTTCPTGYAKSASCMSGKTRKLKCNSCASGYVKQNGKCYKKLDCKNGSTQKANKCVCTEGWEGNLCQTAKKCPYTTTKCTLGYEATGNTCLSGNNTYVECKAKECKGYNYTTCPTGYKESSKCTSGTVKKMKCNNCADGYIKLDGKCYKDLDCQNGGTQQGDKCICTEGWKGTNCTTRAACAYNTTSCAKGYEETGNTCKSGNMTYKECRAKAIPSGYTKTKCGAGYTQIGTFLSGTTTYYKCKITDCSAYQTSCGAGYDAAQSCLSGETPYYTCTPKKVPVGYTTTPCGAGYIQQDMMLSGEDTYYKCVAIDCSAYQASCGAGYDATQSCLSGETPYYTCTPKEVPEGYTTTPCGAGYTELDTFLSGEDTYYKCEEKSCSEGTAISVSCGEGYHSVATGEYSGTHECYKCEENDCGDYVAQCGTGYHKTGRTCQSGEQLLYECEINSCFGYVTECGSGYHVVGEPCYSGETIKYRCEKNDCSAYQTSCGEGYDATASCVSDEIQYYTCTPKQVPEGYTNKACGAGYIQQDVMLSGETYYYLCKIRDCSQYQTSCGEGYDATESCVSGETSYYTCTPKVVPAGYTKKPCDSGYTQVDKLVSGEDTYYKCVVTDCSAYQTSCGVGYDAVASCLSGTTQYYTCTPKQVPVGYTAQPCGAGYTQQDVMLSGETYYYLCEAKSCEGFEYTECPDGYQVVDSCRSGDKIFYKCEDSVINEEPLIGEKNSVNNASIELDNDIDRDVYGMQGTGKVTNAMPVSSESEVIGNIDIHNQGQGNVYGIDGYVAQNARAGYSVAENSSSEAHLSIENESNSDVFGLKGDWVSENALADHQSTTVFGEISISNEGNGSVYGAYADSVKNANIANIGSVANYNNLLAELMIENTGVGSVYGLYGWDDSANINIEASTVSNSNVQALLNIINHGDGSVYGVKSNRRAANIYPSGNAVFPDSVLESIIRVYNEGNADIYGIFSGVNAYNNNASSGVAKVITVNDGLGNAYGMFGKNVYNESDENHSSTIEMVNRGNGLAVGIYAKDGNVNNSGDIKIHNLGNGVAVGIMADGTTKVTNAGTITIDRNAYTDDMGTSNESDDVTYRATLTRGGRAIGIYGAINSRITNTGTIMISGASDAYGIWSEGSDVTNIGTILIDGAYTENAIRLNGGQLFQDGKMIIGADWNNNGETGSPVLNCVHGTQSGNICVCEAGWGGDLCDEDIASDLVGTTANVNNDNINITNSYNRNVFGMRANSTIYNSRNSEGSITITNYGNGNVYGMYGPSAYTYNVKNETDGEYASGKIIISNYGNGDVYGVKGTDNASSSTSINTYGLISLRNSGTGNVYGVYNKDFWTYNVWGKGTGIINIVNKSAGNAYGMYSGYEINNESDENRISVVEMANVGDGLTVGLYAEKGTVNNSGDIKIHNLGNGVAVGVMANGTAEVNNSGTITIDRNAYTDNLGTDDEADDVTYRATSTRGGKAIGIYGAINSRINNSGTITISGASDAYGIWSEGSNVTNTGIILIDGAYTENAIRLNGGQLFQDGKMIVNADWDNNGETGSPVINCVHGTQIGSTCVCEEGWGGDLCDEDIVSDLIGTTAHVNNSDINIVNLYNRDAYGMKNTGDATNAMPTKQENYVLGNINIQNRGQGNVYGVDGYLAQNARAGYDGTDNSRSIAYLSIDNKGHGDVFGLKGKWVAENALVDRQETMVFGEISISNEGNGSVYGTYANSVKNANIANIGAEANRNNLSAKLTIENTGDGSVYGLFGNNESINMNIEASTVSSSTIYALLNIINHGNGSVYGVKSDNVAANIKIDTVSTFPDSVLESIIRVYNEGNADIYGVFSGEKAYNNYSSSGVAKVITINNGIGNAYGMYGQNVYNESGANRSSIIEMVNRGDGLAVGIYAKDGNVNNSGDIKIHNLGNGIAVGIMADGTTSVTNSGTITIDRNAYTDDMGTSDESDDVTYRATLTRGGRAIGIYGAINSRITNTGTIMISGASDAYGIWSEGSNVTNTGTILIDGAYTENAIRLNGGQLFQDGVLKVSADWSNNGESGSEPEIECEHGVVINNQCVCNKGYMMIGEKCQRVGLNDTVNNAEIIIDNQDDVDVYGMYGYNESLHNAENNDKASTIEGRIVLENEGDGNVYGLFSNSYLMNAVGYDHGINGLGSAVGYIDITNTGSGHVYGMYNDASSYYSYNAYSYGASISAKGNIIIVNEGSGDVHGMYGSDGANNIYSAYAYSSGTAEGNINITNSGNGNVYGMLISNINSQYGSSGYNAGNNVTYNGSLGVAKGSIIISNEGEGQVYGMNNSGKGSIYNAYNGSLDGTAEGSISITNHGDNGQVYGIYSFDATNAYNYLRDSDWSGTAKGTISIINEGDDTVYGMYGMYSTDSSVINASHHSAGGKSSGDTQGIIDIANQGHGNVYGMYGYSKCGAYNAIGYDDSTGSFGTAEGIININNEGNGDVYGMYSDSAVTNADNRASAYGTIKGSIIITNKGDGDIHGIFGSESAYDVFNAYNWAKKDNSYSIAEGYMRITNNGNGNVYGIHKTGDKSAEVYNAYNSSSSVTAKGNITLINDGTGDAYGIFGGINHIYNAHNYVADGNSVAEGIINIINKSSGNAYGMSGRFIDNEGGANLSSIIEMANVGDGLAVGIYAKNGSVNNSGEITIHNLASGAAVGIYADGTSSVTNSGTITIDRNEYTDDMGTDDKDDDVTYMATSTIGGKAVGIYGASGSRITNTGTITINNASAAYGIYSEGSDVTNTGTILIDGNANFANAIVLNGGQLFQDGKMIVDAVWDESNPKPEIECVHGVIENDQCICDRGWEGEYCDTEIASKSWIGKSDSANNTVIEFNNEEYRDIYGLYDSYYGSAVNANEQDGTIRISNSANGNVYGVYSEPNDSNVSSASNAISGTGIISIDNSGDGDVYGVYSSTILSNTSSNTAGNAYGNGMGIVRIYNSGSGSSYGLYGNNVNNNGGSHGSADGSLAYIWMVNHGSGNAYGMYSTFENEGRGLRYAYNKGNAFVEMANVGDGLAVGIYAKDAIIDNSGEITIHNLGNGVAVGIMADGTSSVTNSGTITIDRSDYTDGKATDDKDDDVTYEARNTVGGKAIGIYGTSGSSITNSGLITINSASNAYGIWSEGSNVANTGTILIDGNANSDNAIRLNGGQLFQDGVLKVGADWNNKGINGNEEPFNETPLVGKTANNNNDTITLNNEEYRNVYGLTGMSDNEVSNAYLNISGSQTAAINITNSKNGNVYGINGADNVYNSFAGTGKSTGNLTINNFGHGDVYGVHSTGYKAINMRVEGSGSADGNIAITNKGDGNVYALWADSQAGVRNVWDYGSNSSNLSTGVIQIDNQGDGTVAALTGSEQLSWATNVEGYGKDYTTLNGKILITNNGTGNVYGIRLSLDGTYATNISSSLGSYALIGITNNGSGNTYGIYAKKIDNAYGRGTGDIRIVNAGTGLAYGLYGKNVTNQSNEIDRFSTIEMANLGNGSAFGIYANDGTVDNSGEITIHNLGSGVAVGIYADGTTTVTNSGTITLDRDAYTDTMGTDDKDDDVTYEAKSTKGGKAIGIYGASGSSITNSGMITINGATMAYGIYSEGSNVTNTGTILIDGNANATNAIRLNGGQLFQDGRLILSRGALETQSAGSMATPKAASLNLDNFGGTVVASETSQFIVDGAIAGDLAMNNSIVENGFDTTYSVAGMIDAEDVSGLRLISQSALFDVALENDSDAVMTMKSFNDVVANQSLADFLKQNYAAENNEELFGMLKGKETVAALNSTLDSLTGNDVFNRFNFEDMTMMRELNMDVNNKLFNDNQDYLTTSGDIAPFYFDSTSGADGKYALYNHRIGKKSFGLSLAFSNVNSRDRHDNNSRQDESFQMSVPFGYKTHGFKFITAPHFGYAYGHYDRDGFESRVYKGTMEKRMFGLMNEARYPVDMGGWKLAPAAEFNMLGYHLKGAEDAAPYALHIKSQNNYSVETGFGLYADKELKLTKDSTLKLNAGVAMYHEFADPYTMELGMQGMNGNFKVRDERRKDNRAVVRTGFDYSMGDVTLEGSFATFVDGTTHTKAGLDLRYNF